MDPNVHEHLEDSWFFGNLLHSSTKPRMLRSYSDPCTSSTDEKSYEETYASINKLPEGNVGFMTKSNLMKAPSMPQPGGLLRHDHEHRSYPRRTKSSNRRKKTEKQLFRAPSLPISLGNGDDDYDEEEIEFSMGKLIRQASMNCTDNLPPRTHNAKVISPSSSISRNRSRRKSEQESIKLENLEEKTPQLPTNRLRTQKSLSVLESREPQGFKDLVFDLDKIELNQNAINITPGRKIDGNGDKNTRESYTDDKWHATSSAPPFPRWGGKKSRDDMKAQIKFWARAVASNVRQEC